MRRRSVRPVDGDGEGSVAEGGGIGPLAATLLLVGAALIIAGLTTLVPMWVLAGGVGLFVLGAVVPLRAMRRGARARR